VKPNVGGGKGKFKIIKRKKNPQPGVLGVGGGGTGCGAVGSSVCRKKGGGKIDGEGKSKGGEPKKKKKMV